MKIKFQSGKDSLILSIMTLLTAISWVGFSIYRALMKTEYTNVTPTMLAPLDPKLKTETLSAIKQKESFQQQDLDILFKNVLQLK